MSQTYISGGKEKEEGKALNSPSYSVPYGICKYL